MPLPDDFGILESQLVQHGFVKRPLTDRDVATGALIQGSKILGSTPVTTLPASPVDTQVCVFTDSTSAPTYEWRLQWNATAAKWMFLGGSPIRSVVATSQTTTSITYVDLGTVGPSITLPLAGDWVFTYGCESLNTNGTSVAPKIGAAATSDADRLINNTTALALTLWRSKTFASLAASTVIKLQYRSNSGATTATFLERGLYAIPVSVT